MDGTVKLWDTPKGAPTPLVGSTGQQ